MSNTNQDITVLRKEPSDSGSSGASANIGSIAALTGDTTDGLASGVLKQRFVLEQKLGSGGMGTVYRAKDLRKVEAQDRQPYLAVKVLNNDFREHPQAYVALEREASKSQTIAHPNIVSIFDFDKDGDIPFITMELLEGSELSDLLNAYPNGLPDHMAWSVIEGMCAGLDHAHKNGVVHSDFKPGNVFVSPTHQAKILDFGIARAVQEHQANGENTVFDPNRLAALTPAYASREMLNGDTPQTRDDLYSLGVVIYLVLTGHHPYGRLSAEDAAKDNLRPEKPKRLSRRQWKMLAKCLQFNRQDRPLSVRMVQQMMLQPAPWRTRTAYVAAAAFVFALGVNYFYDDAQLTEVAQEVRQTTLLDSQLSRLDGLTSDAKFDAGWQQNLTDELGVLKELDVQNSYYDTVVARIQQVYENGIADSSDYSTALQLYTAAGAFGKTGNMRENLRQVFYTTITDSLASPVPTQEWLDQVSEYFSQYNEMYPEHKSLSELNLSAVNSVSMQLTQAVTADDIPLAENALAYLEGVAFDDEHFESLSELVTEARTSQEQADRARNRARNLQKYNAKLDGVLGGSCLRLDFSNLKTNFDRVSRDFPNFVKHGQRRARAVLSKCGKQVSEVDKEKAAAIASVAVADFGQKAAAKTAAVDPCGLDYLLGNGTAAGRSGHCVDQLASGGVGPKLVVVPGLTFGDRFAVTKFEISNAEFKEFCGSKENCDLAAEASLPVTGVSVELAQGYASWLSKASGYQYRLPTLAEWQQSANGPADPNRNCQIDLEGVQRGIALVAAAAGQANPFGLVNTLGNAQEWVRGPEGLRAAGGTYKDPIAQCVADTVKPDDGKPSGGTGFRLVRDIR